MGIFCLVLFILYVGRLLLAIVVLLSSDWWYECMTMYYDIDFFNRESLQCVLVLTSFSLCILGFKV